MPLTAALAELDRHFGRLPVRHWLSTKTQPLRPLLQWWRQEGRPVEVVSEFELLAARAEGFAPDQILVNGPAKHRWLSRHRLAGLRVNFDSLNEASALLPLARKLDWSVGLRIHTGEERDPEAPRFHAQFGLSPSEAALLLRWAPGAGLQLDTVHFHLRTNVASARVYERALEEVAALCRESRFAPRFVDCGGGFPAPHVLTREGKALGAGFRLAEMAAVCARALKLFPGAREIWMENGRWVSARSGVLVVRVLDAKERAGRRHLICDGGRTTNALVSNWENHALLTLPPRGGRLVPTTVNGPTCMAFDQLTRGELPCSVKPGDHLVWLDAGAYHLPWETRFSHGQAAVFWHDGQRTRLVRPAETFAEWWGQWQ